MKQPGPGNTFLAPITTTLNKGTSRLKEMNAVVICVNYPVRQWMSSSFFDNYFPLLGLMPIIIRSCPIPQMLQIKHLLLLQPLQCDTGPVDNPACSSDMTLRMEYDLVNSELAPLFCAFQYHSNIGYFVSFWWSKRATR